MLTTNRPVKETQTVLVIVSEHWRNWSARVVQTKGVADLSPFLKFVEFVHLTDASRTYGRLCAAPTEAVAQRPKVGVLKSLYP